MNKKYFSSICVTVLLFSGCSSSRPTSLITAESKLAAAKNDPFILKNSPLALAEAESTTYKAEMMWREDHDKSEVNRLAQNALEQIENVRQKFLGEIDQIPPMFSAIKHKGKPLYHFARQGKVITREPRKINIISFEINKIELPVIHFKIICSKGTYIRSIANDFGREIGCGAYLSELRRTNIGEYDVADAFSVFEFMDLIKANTGKT